MTFLIDAQELKSGLIVFRRSDVKHNNWYCRIKVPKEDRYKTVSLKTSDLKEARERAFDAEAELRFKVKHEVPLFNRTFGQVAKEFSEFQKRRSDAGQIGFHRWRVTNSHILTQLDPYLGNVQITQVTEDKWKEYPLWRKSNGKGRGGGIVSDGAIRQEMTTFRSIMRFAAEKQYVREAQMFRGAMPMDKARREEFTPDEYRKLHTFARTWITRGRRDLNVWYRTMAYNFILIMTNTGMRTPEARNLRWRDIATQGDRQGRQFVSISVRGKGQFRTLVAPSNVFTYLERIRAISKATQPDDFVFSTFEGKSAIKLYYSLIEDLLKESGLLLSSSGRRRSTYCFRHTYATFRLSEGVDVYFLAKQMGTSVKMIENHYGHITPLKNADRILQGLPGWEMSGSPDVEVGMNADVPGNPDRAD